MQQQSFSACHWSETCHDMGFCCYPQRRPRDAGEAITVSSMWLPTAGSLTKVAPTASEGLYLFPHAHCHAQAAAAAEAKSQFLARMSHEIRTPLNGMIAVGQLLAETALSPAQWDLVNTVRCSGETLLTLISDILDFSRIEVLSPLLQPKDMPCLHTVLLSLASSQIAGSCCLPEHSWRSAQDAVHQTC